MFCCQRDAIRNLETYSQTNFCLLERKDNWEFSTLNIHQGASDSIFMDLDCTDLLWTLSGRVFGPRNRSSYDNLFWISFGRRIEALNTRKIIWAPLKVFFRTFFSLEINKNIRKNENYCLFPMLHFMPLYIYCSFSSAMCSFFFFMFHYVCF